MRRSGNKINEVVWSVPTRVLLLVGFKGFARMIRLNGSKSVG